MSLSPFGRSKFKIDRRSAPRPQEATLEDFSGGLNTIENDLRLTTRESKVEVNVHRDIDGTKSVRWGTRLFADLNGTVNGAIIEIVYFQRRLIAFTEEGEIATIDDSGTMTLIWDDAIAALLPGAPTGWSSGLTIIDTTEFRNELVVCNGIDKPILIADDYTVTYLQDLATGSNVNTPIGKYVTTAGNYVIIAGVAASPDVIYISSQGTSGTWPGDPAPNDSLSFNIAAYAPQQGGNIRGLSSFRNHLVVHFVTSSVVLVLGEYTGAVHVPSVLDTIPEHGVISHRTQVVLDADIVYTDSLGVYKAKRNVFGNALETDKLSRNVNDHFVSDVVITSDAIQDKTFSVHNPIESRIFYFFYDGTDYHMMVMSYVEGLKPNKIAWGHIEGWDFVCGTNSVKGRVFLCRGQKIYQYGNGVFEGEDYTGDFMAEFDDVWLTATLYPVGHVVYVDFLDKYYTALVEHTSGFFEDDLDNNLWEEYLGAEIEFDWELPWSDINSRMKKKRISYIGIDTVGTAAFTIEVYVDNIRVDENGNDDPALNLEFVAGDSGGYGGDGSQPYGGGRRAADERLWGFPCEFKLLKPRFKGSTNKRLAFVSITFLLVRGTYKR